jgi:hypothetical protein
MMKDAYSCCCWFIFIFLPVTVQLVKYWKLICLHRFKETRISEVNKTIFPSWVVVVQFTDVP